MKRPEEAVREWLFFPISASDSIPITSGLILKILRCIPAVKIFPFLDLGKNISFSDSLQNPLKGYLPLQSPQLHKAFLAA